ncbi:MAG: hypothetical protein AB8B93_15170 [Pseudomonadales bacterium]
MLRKSLAAAIAALSACSAHAMPVDLSGWQSEQHTRTSSATNSGANWTVQGANNDSVFQSVNGRPTVFFDPLADAQGTALSGEITVETNSDDDFVGFVLGYETGEINSTASDFILIDWKQGTQPNGGDGTADEGLAISHVTSASGEGLWGRETSNTPVGVREIARATNLGDTGWVDNQTYSFDLVFTSSLIQVLVDDILELSITAAEAGLTGFADGSFGFYNYSQSSVRYAGISESIVIDPDPDPDPNPVPGPAPLGLLLLGAAALQARRRMS